MTPRRVLHVINTAAVGGGAEHLCQLAVHLPAHGYASEVLAGTDGPATARLRALGVPVTAWGAMRWGAPLALRHHLRLHRPDLLHLHGSRAGAVGALVARGGDAPPIVYTAHAFAFHRRLPAPLRAAAALMEQATGRAAARIICLSDGDRRAALAHHLPAGRLALIRNGIDAARFADAAPIRADLGLADGAPVIALIARLVPQKNPLAFVRIAARIAPHAPDARFLVVGDGPLRGEVARAVHAAGLQERVLLTGVRHDIPQVLASCDIVVAPSRWEGLPLGLLEAMAAGRAVVASRLPGHAEVIEEGRSGVLVGDGDEEGFARAILALYADRARGAALGQAAHARVADAFAVTRMAAATAALYDAVLGATGAAG